MIRELFLPEKLGSYRIYGRRIVGIYVHEQKVLATFVSAKRSGYSIEKFVELDIVLTEGLSREESVVTALKQLTALLKKDDEIRIAIPAASAVLKEITLPFIDPEKIRMVLEYEIEAMLPFALDDAVIDFIVTKTILQEGSSQILAVAVRKQDLAALLALYKAAEIEPSVVTLDLFSFYGLYQQIHEYQADGQSSAFVEINDSGTRITFLQDNQLKLTRYLPRGLAAFVKNISEESELSLQEVEAMLFASGFKLTENHRYNKAVQSHLMNFFNEIQFTLNSFSLKLNYYDGVNTIFFGGKVTHISGFVESSFDLLQIKCALFDPKKILNTKGIKSSLKENSSSWDLFTVPLGIAIASPLVSAFNLRRRDFELINYELFSRQFFTAVVVAASIIIGVGLHGFWQISSLASQVASIEKEQVKKLNKFLPKKDKLPAAKLKAVLTRSEKLLKEKKALWARFSQERAKPLELLLEITNLLDKRLFAIDIDELSISEKESGSMELFVDGYFKSDRGNFKDWEEPKKRIKESSILELVDEPLASPAAEKEKGLQFKLHLKKRSDQQSESAASSKNSKE